MSKQETKRSSPAVALPFLIATANTLAQILASQNKFEESSNQSSTETTNTKTTNTETTDTKTTTSSSPSESSRATYDPAADREIRERSPSLRPTSPLVSDGPDLHTDSEDIECQTCHQVKSKYDFSMDQRETYPDSVGETLTYYVATYTFQFSKLLLSFFPYSPLRNLPQLPLRQNKIVILTVHAQICLFCTDTSGTYRSDLTILCTGPNRLIYYVGFGAIFRPGQRQADPDYFTQRKLEWKARVLRRRGCASE